MKKSRAGKDYDLTEPNPDNCIAREPEAIYIASSYNPSIKSVLLMGMAGKKDFNALSSDADFIDLIRAGIPKQAMTNLMEATDISLTEMAAITHTSDRTLRRYKPQQKLPQEQSERLIELAKLYTRGEEVFGTMHEFGKWMETELLPFGNRKPKAYLDTSMGIRLIMDELGRIEHGIFA